MSKREVVSKKDVLVDREARIRELEAQLAVVQGMAAISAVQRGSPSPTVSAGGFVGIRNISDSTIGITGKFGEPDIHLHAQFAEPDPANVTVISHAWWRELRKSKYVANGQIVRDDTILGAGFTAAPPDRPEELPPSAAINQVFDPVQWVESRTEQQIRDDLGKITSDASLRRIRRAVDMYLHRLESGYSDNIENKAAQAVNDLPAIYRMIDDVITRRLEKIEERL